MPILLRNIVYLLDFYIIYSVSNDLNKTIFCSFHFKPSLYNSLPNRRCDVVFCFESIFAFILFFAPTVYPYITLDV